MGNEVSRLICPKGSSKKSSWENDDDAPSYSSTTTADKYRTNKNSSNNSAADGGTSPRQGTILASVPIPEIVGIPVGQDDKIVATKYKGLLQAVARESAFFASQPAPGARPSDSRKGYDVSREWRLLYSTAIQGRSFPQLVRRITNAGPTLVVISGSSTGTDPQKKFILGGVNISQWKTVAERKGDSEFRSSLGTSSSSSSPSSTTAKQDPRFFGDPRCFVFRHDTTAPGGGASTTTEQPTLLKARENINKNYMYFFDEHPTEEDRIGFGMGGQVGYHAWYVDSMLEYCYCKSRRCTTFDGCEALHPTEEKLPIGTLEVYALDSNMLPPELRRELERKALVKRYAADMAGVDPSAGPEELDEDGNPKQQKSLLERMDPTAKALLEIGGAHQFYSDLLDNDVEDPADVEQRKMMCKADPRTANISN